MKNCRSLYAEKSHWACSDCIWSMSIVVALVFCSLTSWYFLAWQTNILSRLNFIRPSELFPSNFSFHCRWVIGCIKYLKQQNWGKTSFRFLIKNNRVAKQEGRFSEIRDDTRRIESNVFCFFSLSGLPLFSFESEEACLSNKLDETAVFATPGRWLVTLLD